MEVSAVFSLHAPAEGLRSPQSDLLSSKAWAVWGCDYSQCRRLPAWIIVLDILVSLIWSCFTPRSTCGRVPERVTPGMCASVLLTGGREGIMEQGRDGTKEPARLAQNLLQPTACVPVSMSPHSLRHRSPWERRLVS